MNQVVHECDAPNPGCIWTRSESEFKGVTGLTFNFL